MPPESQLKRTIRAIAGFVMVAVGVLHFVAPAGFVKIVPAWLPAPLFLVLLSGFFEILGGVGLFVRRAHRLAAWGLIALYVAVFPANINMAIHGIQPDGMHLSAVALWARLPFQAVLIWVAWWLSRSPVGAAPEGAKP
jgi:uncharacterized membrane protein